MASSSSLSSSFPFSPSPYLLSLPLLRSLLSSLSSSGQATAAAPGYGGRGRTRRQSQVAVADTRTAAARLRRRGCARAWRGYGGRDARRRTPAVEADVCTRSFSCNFFFVILGFYSLGLNVVIYSEAFLVPRSFSDLSFLPTVACSSFFSVLDEQQEQSRADSGRKKTR